MVNALTLGWVVSHNYHYGEVNDVDDTDTAGDDDDNDNVDDADCSDVYDDDNCGDSDGGETMSVVQTITKLQTVIFFQICKTWLGIDKFGCLYFFGRVLWKQRLVWPIFMEIPIPDADRYDSEMQNFYN